MDHEISEDDEKKVDVLRKQIEELLNEHKFAAAYVTVIIPPEDPDWGVDKDRKWLIDDTLYMSEEYTKLAKANDDKEDLSVEDRIQLMDLYHNILIVLNRMASYHIDSYDQVKGWIFELTESLGLDKSRIIPLEPDTEYHVITDAGTYQLKYDPELRFFIKTLDNEDKNDVIPEDALSLIGCLQDDGAIFGLPHAPAISTGDKVLFQYYPFDPDKGITSDTFLTDRVLDVVKSANIN